MIISDLQHIESATETEIQGGDRPRRWHPWYQTYTANARIVFEPVDFGTDTETFTSTDTLSQLDQLIGIDANGTGF